MLCDVVALTFYNAMYAYCLLDAMFFRTTFALDTLLI